MVYNTVLEEAAMKIFKSFGKLTIHEIGAIFENNVWNGTALLSKTSKHTSISFNKQDFRFASNCLQYVFCQNNKDQIAIISMAEAKELFKRGDDRGEFIVVEWIDIQNPDGTYEIPFN
jgi:hypothetical protein